MKFQEWWDANAKRYYVSEPPPRKGWMVDVARDAWNAALAARPEGGPPLYEKLLDHWELALKTYTIEIDRGRAESYAMREALLKVADEIEPRSPMNSGGEKR